MKVLILSPYPEPIVEAVEASGDLTVVTTDALTREIVKELEVDYVVSYGYRHIIRQPVLDYMGDRILNLHISFLPYNRGSDPFFWACVEGTPVGVTIHRVDAGLDTGDILLQKQIHLHDTETLETGYWKLRREVEALFAANWNLLRDGKINAFSQEESKATLHRVADKNTLFQRLPLGYMTSLRQVKCLSQA